MLQSVMLDIGIFGYQCCFDPDYACTTLLKFADKKMTVWVVISLFNQRLTLVALHDHMKNHRKALNTFKYYTI